MSLELPSNMRFIPANLAAQRQWEAFPYSSASYVQQHDGAEDEDASVAESLGEPEDDAQRIANADQIIQQKLQQAEIAAQEIARQAYEEGFAAGESEGRTFGESQFKVLAERLDQQMDELSKAATLLSQASKDEVLALSIAMGEYLAAQHLHFSRDGILELLEKVLAGHPVPGPHQEALDIYLNPKDKELLGDRFIDKPGIRLLEDPDLSRGSLMVHSPEGVLEATLERRTERLFEAIHRFREEKMG